MGTLADDLTKAQPRIKELEPKPPATSPWIEWSLARKDRPQSSFGARHDNGEIGADFILQRFFHYHQEL
jgi:hypothetical protein